MKLELERKCDNRTQILVTHEMALSHYLYKFHEMFSVLGDGTPENPGGDFGMYCWIQAADKTEALSWGHVLLGDYYKHRFSRTDAAETYDGSPIQRGEIESDLETIERLRQSYSIPECEVGVIPDWDRPWRISNLNPKQSKAD